jgi:hypothetical protein
METEMVVSLQDLNALERGNYALINEDTGFSCSHLLPNLIAAARAHLEGQECKCKELVWDQLECPIHGPQPPQQREDAECPKCWGNGFFYSTQNLSELGEKIACECQESMVLGASPDTNFSKRKSEDAGLVDSQFPSAAVIKAKDAALEAKDAEIASLKSEIDYWEVKEKEAKRCWDEAQAEIERLQAKVEELGFLLGKISNAPAPL